MGDEHSPMEGESFGSAGKDETDDFYYKGTQAALPQEMESALVEHVPPDAALWMGSVMGMLERYSLTVIEGLDPGLKRVKIRLAKYPFFHYSVLRPEDISMVYARGLFSGGDGWKAVWFRGKTVPPSKGLSSFLLRITAAGINTQGKTSDPGTKGWMAATFRSHPIYGYETV